MNSDSIRTSCPGYLDNYGIWNNGFDCPPIQSQIRSCCGTESKRYCCSDNTIHRDRSKLINIISSTSDIFLPTSSSPSYRFLSSSLLTSLSSSRNLYFSLPILISFIIGLLSVIFLILFICRYRLRKSPQALQKKQQLILLDSNIQIEDSSQYPFSYHNHHHYIRKHEKQTCSNLRTSDITTTTTTATSSSSGELSTMYFNDWKEFLVSESTPMNLYPSMSSNSISDEYITTPYTDLFSKKNHQII
ncbi:unnamed protein product [Didymodactylos carnosus]|nr:unnamed protein product [Didymodactylos carnosus]CAF4377908.1 unnamed protein product [Didymodactylos carnosus]